MKRLLIIISTVVALPGGLLYGQTDLNTFLTTIKSNNPVLQAAAKNADAAIARARIGLNPVDPSVDFGYFPGSRSGIGAKTTLNASLAFSFPTTYLSKRSVAKLTSSRIAEELKGNELGIMVAAAQLYVQAVYLNRSCAEFKKRVDDADATRSLIERKTQAGDANVLEVQKARMEAVMLKNEYDALIARKAQLIGEITAMNGDKVLSIDDTIYPALLLPAADSILTVALKAEPVIKVLEAENLVAKQTVRLQKSLWLPQFKVGYGEETVLKDTYRGVQAGITVPLWQNTHTVKQAVLRQQAIEKEHAAVASRVKTDVASAVIAVNTLKTNLERSAGTLETMRSDNLLKTSLETGHISIIEYYQERRFWFQIQDRYLREEWEYYSELVNVLKYFW